MITPEIQKIIARAITEDRIHHDVTTRILVPQDHVSEAHVMAKEDSVICGLEIIKEIFRSLDPQMRFKLYFRDGDEVKKYTKIVNLKGKTRALLSGERVSLNFLSYLSGIATLTHKFVAKVRPYNVKIMDTRKTIPSLRALVKMAVRIGGGVNHRFNLKEMVMIKDNHQIAYCQQRSIRDAVSRIRKRTNHLIVVEVETLAEYKKALEAAPDIILLDNMSVSQLRKAVRWLRGSGQKCLLEASGGVNLHNIRAVAKSGVDRISIGAITHSPKAVDYSMEFVKYETGL